MLDGVFFVVSKLGWALISPDSLIVLLGLAAWISLLLGWQRLSRRSLSLLTLLLLCIGFLPVGEWLIAPLETRFAANAALPAEADGVIVLGGAIAPALSESWGQVEFNDSGERLTSFLYLARLYPGAQLVYTGGSGSLGQQELREADYAQFLLGEAGLAERAIVFERDSRNTAENAANSRRLVNPGADGEWILITSAFHMPRAVAVFCQQDWPVTPYPVDHKAETGNLLRVEFAFAGHLDTLRTAVREWVGLLAYRLSGRTSHLLPADDNHCAVAENIPHPETSPSDP